MPGRLWVDILNKQTGRRLLRRARWCATFWCRLRGLMFRPALPAGESLVLVEVRESRAATAIHMFFVSFDIAAVWLDGAGRVVDKALARRWRPYYAARAPARFVLEAGPEFLEQVQIGDELVFEDCP